MHSAATIAWYAGYCAACDREQPLVLVEHGPRGLRAWLSGFGADDRTLSYCCRVCGRDEHVPLTEAEDAAHEATLVRWPDTFLAPEPVAEPVPVVVDLVTRRPVDLRLLLDELALDVAEAEAAVVDVELHLPEPVGRRPVAVVPPVLSRPVVRVLPVPRVSATDLLLPVSA